MEPIVLTAEQLAYLSTLSKRELAILAYKVSTGLYTCEWSHNLHKFVLTPKEP